MAEKSRKTAVRKKAKRKRRMQGTCMVLTPFKEPFDTYFLSIVKPAVTAASLEAVRGDSLFRPSPIMADVWQMIQDAKILIADLSEKNANVFYELGLAHAVGKPVILLADNIGDVPFDLQSLRVLVYDKNEPAWGAELKASITASIIETLGDTTSAVPSMFRKVVKSQAPMESRTEYRLDRLERAMAALTGGARSQRFRVRSPSELLHSIRLASSASEVVEICKAALVGGMPMRLIEDVLRRGIGSPREVRAILEELKMFRGKFAG